MRTSERAYHQICWDPRLDPAQFVMGIDVHGPAPKRIPVPDFDPNGDIPWHRVLFVEFQNERCWDRQAGVDILDDIATSGAAIPRVLAPPAWEPRVLYAFDGVWAAYSSPGDVDRVDRLRVLTYNVLWDRYDAEHINSEARWPRLLDLALATGADVIAFQEVRHAFHRLVLDHPTVQEHYWVSHPVGHPDVGAYDLLIIGRVPAREVALTELGPHKAALAVALAEGPTLVTTHLTSDHSAKAASRREKELAQILLAMEGMAGPWILLGDFNEPAETPIAGLVDAWTAVQEPVPTFDPTENPLAALSSRRGLAVRLDRVLLHGPIAPVSAELVGTEPEEELFPSDHYGVLATLEFSNHPSRYLGPPSVRSALVWIPADDACGPIQEIREARDPAVSIWPPHVTVMWGFVPEAELEAATTALTAAAQRVRDWETCFQRGDVFGGREPVHALVPDDDAPWQRLYRAFRHHFPSMGASAYSPHLTLARGGNPPWWPRVQGAVRELAILTRRGEEPCVVRGRIRLGHGVMWESEPPWHPGPAQDVSDVLAALSSEQSVPGTIELTGSRALGLAIDGTDLDVLALAPQAQPEQMREAFHTALQAESSVLVSKMGLPGIRLRRRGLRIDIVLVEIGNIPLSDAVDRRAELPPPQCHALTAVSDAVAVLEQVAGREDAFCRLGRWVKAWARAHALDEAALGGLEGLAWAVLTAQIVSSSETLEHDALVAAFIAEWAAWDWAHAVGGPGEPGLDVCIYTPSPPRRPITYRARRGPLEDALIWAWELLENGASPEDLLRPRPWHRLHAQAIEVVADSDAAWGAARGQALALIHAVSGSPRSLGERGFAIGLPRTADLAEVDAVLEGWNPDPGVRAQRRPTESLNGFRSPLRA